MEKMKAVLIDVRHDTASVIEIEKSLEAYYDAIGCDIIDIVNRRIGRKRFLIICDDEGLYNGPKISAIDNLGQCMLVGNLIVCNDGGEDVAGLSDKDAKYVMERVVRLATTYYPEGYPILTQVEY